MAVAMAGAMAGAMADPSGSRGSHSTPITSGYLCMHRHLSEAAIGAIPELARPTMHARRA